MIARRFFLPSFLPAGLLVLVMGALSACSYPIVDSRGFIFDKTMLSKVEVGKTKKERVRNLLGNPSAEDPFTPDWYYMHSLVKTESFYAPETQQRDIVAIYFDDKDMVKEIKMYSLEDGTQVVFDEEVTKTYGLDFSLWRQLIGNIGRFQNAPGGGTP